MTDNQRTRTQYHEDPTSGESLLQSIFQGYADYIHSLFQGAAVAGRSTCDFFGLPCDEIVDFFSTILAIPIAIIKILWWMLTWCVYLLTSPVRLVLSFVISFPILTLIVILFIFSLGYVVRRLTRTDPLQYLLYSVIPYCGALLYSILSIFIPQLDMFKKIFYLLFHPIQFFLDLFAKVDQRAERVRDVVNVFDPAQAGRRRPVSRLLCSKCLRNEKTCLLTPCNHFCMCEPCYDRMSAEVKPTCPQCLAPVNSFIKIDL